MEIKSGKKELSLSFYYIYIYIYIFFFFFKVSSNQCFTSEILLVLFLVKSYSIRPPTFAAHLKKRHTVPAFLKVSVSYLVFDNLDSGKRNYLFYQKVWN